MESSASPALQIHFYYHDLAPLKIKILNYCDKNAAAVLQKLAVGMIYIKERRESNNEATSQQALE